MRIRGIAVMAAGALLAVTAAACSSGTTTTTTTPTTAAPVPTTAPATASATQFGAGCAAVPTDASNPGSFDAMSKVPVATAASGNPLLSTLVSAVTQAGLADSLNSAQGITVFAPANSAFAKIPSADLAKVLADKATLTKILTYHVVPQQLSPDQLAGSHKTLEGASLTVTGSGTNFTVDGSAAVVCGNVQTANATVYIIDSVLMPAS
jgi:uncharacterized surface protein with fasciclin (FAS1) repeats